MWCALVRLKKKFKSSVFHFGFPAFIFTFKKNFFLEKNDRSRYGNESLFDFLKTTQDGLYEDSLISFFSFSLCLCILWILRVVKTLIFSSVYNLTIVSFVISMRSKMTVENLMPKVFRIDRERWKEFLSLFLSISSQIVSAR